MISVDCMVLIVHNVPIALKNLGGTVNQQTTSAILIKAVAEKLGLCPQKIHKVDVVRRSVDARKRCGKIDIKLVYNLHVHIPDKSLEMSLLNDSSTASIVKELESHDAYRPVHYPSDHTIFQGVGSMRPLVVGAGPAGLFSAYTLAASGFKPVIIEMGPKVERRAKDLMNFWKHNVLTPNSNGVFGEGGAGAFSDGKLTTRTSSPYHRYVHDMLIKCGAKPNILYESRAHVGTDELRKIITKFSRDEIEANGGTFLYNTRLSSISLKASRAAGISGKEATLSDITLERMPFATVEEENDFLTSYRELMAAGMVEHSTPTSRLPQSLNDVPGSFQLHASDLFLGTGHSARQVYELLHAAGVHLSRKDFAVGLRLQISQKYINKLHFGEEARNPILGAAEFTLKHFCPETNRNVYTFCMCPGGVIVNASHGGGEVAVNGMSYSTRGSKYANSAFVVPVGGSDFDGYGNNDALSGLRFQQFWEKCCFEEAGSNYAAPAQRVQDYINFRSSIDTSLPDHKFMGTLKSANLHNVLPEYVSASLVGGIKQFAKRLPGLIGEDTLLVGIESRTSAPVRIDRDTTTLESVNVGGLYPIGEGAGYAGGIMTACVDGVRAAEAMISRRLQRCSS